MRGHRIIVLIVMAVALSLSLPAQDFKAYEQDYTSPPPSGAGRLITGHSHHSSWGGSSGGNDRWWNGPDINAYGPGWGANGFGPNIPMWGTTPGMMTGGSWSPGAWNGPEYPPPVNYNNGILHIVAVGYDAQGVWQTVPIIVEYQWNGVDYDLTVIDAWNPWTRAWDGRLDISAFQTQYALRGVTYDWYVNLSTGTYYFNL